MDDGNVPIDGHIVDRRVLIRSSERRAGELEVYGLLEGANPSVMSWAESLYEAYRADSEPLDPATLPSR